LIDFQRVALVRLRRANSVGQNLIKRVLCCLNVLRNRVSYFASSQRFTDRGIGGLFLD
jgi:hypothetical protein